MKRKVGLAVLLTVVLVLSSLFAFGGVFAKQPDNGAGPPLTILVMGYGWYTGIPEGQTNNSEDVAFALDGEMIKARDEKGRVVAQGMVHGFSVPVVWDVVFPMIIAAVEELDPDIILGVGTGPPLQMEKYGGNVMSGADAWDPLTDIRWCGYKKIDEREGAPDIREGSLPFEQMVIACLKAGIPARLGYVRSNSSCPTSEPSPKTPPCEDDWAACPEVFPDGRPRTSPGWYMCNYMTYGIPMLIEDHGWDAIGGFIHIQTRPEYKTMGRVADIEALGPDPDPEALEDLLNNSISAATSLDRNIAGVRIALQECVRAAAAS